MAVCGVGVDCIYFVASVLHESGVIPAVRLPGYNPAEGLHDRSERLGAALEQCLHGRRVEKSEPEFGDVAVFRTGRMSGHCGFVTDGKLAHALAHQSVMLTDYRVWRAAVSHLFRIEAIDLRVNPSDLWRDTRD
jgi:hypothetical protein